MTLPGEAGTDVVCVTATDNVGAVDGWGWAAGAAAVDGAGGGVEGPEELDTGAAAGAGWLTSSGELAPGLARSRMA